MARRCKVKCKSCGKELINLEAYKVSKNGKNIYYCSEEEYNIITKEEDEKNKCLKEVTKIIKVSMLPPVLTKQINTLREFYEYPVILRTFKDKTDAIRWALEHRTFNSEFTKYKYIITIIMNNIEASKKAMDKERKEIEELFINKPKVDEEVMSSIDTITVKSKRNVNDISEFLFDD